MSSKIHKKRGRSGKEHVGRNLHACSQLEPEVSRTLAEKSIMFKLFMVSEDVMGVVVNENRSQ